MRKPWCDPYHSLSHTFFKDSHSVVKAGQIVKVKVLEVDAKRKRIALTMRLTDTAGRRVKNHQRPSARSATIAVRANRRAANRTVPPASALMGSAMAAAFSKLKGETGLQNGKEQNLPLVLRV
jgi:uncharacterized protein